MSEHHRGAWGARDEAMWWPSAIAADQQTLQHHQHLLHQQQLAVQQQAQIDAANSSASATQQLFTYKMASSFQNPTTTVSNATSTSPVGAAGIRGYDYGGMTGGNPTMSAPAPAAQWWYAPGNMDNMHNTLLNSQNMQNNMQHMPQQSQQHQQQQSQQNMPPVQTPPPAQSESQNRQEEAHRQQEAVNRQHQEAVQRQQEAVNRQHQEAVQRQQEVHRQHQEAHRQHQEAQRHHQEAQRHHQERQQEAHRQHEVQRQQQEAHRQHQEAIQHHHQAIAEAQARQQQLQQQTQQLQQQLQHNQLQNSQLQNNHQHQVLQQHQQITSQAPLPHKGRMPRAKADARPRGRMTAYAFFVQTCREEHKKKHPEENVVFAEFSKKCAERWKTKDEGKRVFWYWWPHAGPCHAPGHGHPLEFFYRTMLDKEKKRFHEMAENDKKRYDTEMLSYTPPKGEKQRGKKRKQVKDPNAPKRSLSAFFWFSNDERGKVKAQNPEYGVGDIAKELGRRWADADPETKGKYEALADKDKARYEKEMTAYKKKNNPAMQQAAVPVPEPEDPEEDEEENEEDEDE